MKPAGTISPMRIKRRGKMAYRYTAQSDPLTGKLDLVKPETDFEMIDRLKLVVADTGENGVFARSIKVGFHSRLGRVCAASASLKRSNLFSIGVFPFAFGTRFSCV